MTFLCCFAPPTREVVVSSPKEFDPTSVINRDWAFVGVHARDDLNEDAAVGPADRLIRSDFLSVLRYRRRGSPTTRVPWTSVMRTRNCGVPRPIRCCICWHSLPSRRAVPACLPGDADLASDSDNPWRTQRIRIHCVNRYIEPIFDVYYHFSHWDNCS